MARPRSQFELLIAYERVEGGSIQATVPAVPGTISVGRTQEEARDNVLDALQEMLATPPQAAVEGMATELLHAQLRVSRRDLGLEI
jgi:predicted RNase H-like HicB family nuclease